MPVNQQFRPGNFLKPNQRFSVGKTEVQKRSKKFRATVLGKLTAMLKNIRNRWE
jgi:hypothetical protein